MTTPTSDVAFTPAVKRMQELRGSRAAYTRMEASHGWQASITDEIAAFIAERESFFFGTASADGQPYIQHRGGPVGFLRVLDDRTLAFADLPGNKQYISTGNLTENAKAIIFLIDYERPARIKIWGTARAVEDDPGLDRALAVPGYGRTPERSIIFTVSAWDVNCPQHIPRLIKAESAEAEIARLKQCINELERASSK